MTLVRVLPPEQYEKIMDLKAKQRAPQEHKRNAPRMKPIAALRFIGCASVPARDSLISQSSCIRALRGRVETGRRRHEIGYTFRNEPIEGWMGEMTMGYASTMTTGVDRVKVGDQITAKVYEGDSHCTTCRSVQHRTRSACDWRSWSRWRWRITRL